MRGELETTAVEVELSFDNVLDFLGSFIRPGVRPEEAPLAPAAGLLAWLVRLLKRLEGIGLLPLLNLKDYDQDSKIDYIKYS